MTAPSARIWPALPRCARGDQLVKLERADLDALELSGDAIHFIQEAYKHCKAIAAIGEAVDLMVLAEVDEPQVAGADRAAARGGSAVASDRGVVTARAPRAAVELAASFVRAIAMHRHWDRDVEPIPA